MAEVVQFNFRLKEVTEILVKYQGIHEGLWAVTFNLNLGAGLMGPTKDEAYPSAMMQIIGVALGRVEEKDLEGNPAAIDASIVNPKHHR